MEFITAPYKTLVTSEQYANAQTHWTKLIVGEISGHFDMALFTDRFNRITEDNVCGTIACSGGYLPETLSIPFVDIVSYLDNDGDIDYDKLIEHYLGINIGRSDEWQWCFDSFWTHIDNTAKGAGIRMRILYEQGLPDSWENQFNGSEELMYQDELK
jgi:hypothetical protein